MHMIKCNVCGELVSYTLLRVDFPRCSRGHELGVWAMCGNEAEQHIYLRNGDNPCPVCGNNKWSRVERGTPVRCAHKTEDGRTCLYPEYLWMVDGPPCHLNHLTTIIVNKAKVAEKQSA